GPVSLPSGAPLLQCSGRPPPMPPTPPMASMSPVPPVPPLPSVVDAPSPPGISNSGELQAAAPIEAPASSPPSICAIRSNLGCATVGRYHTGWEPTMVPTGRSFAQLRTPNCFSQYATGQGRLVSAACHPGLLANAAAQVSEQNQYS